MWKQYKLFVWPHGHTPKEKPMLETKSLVKAYEAAAKWKDRGYRVELHAHNVHVVDLDFNEVPVEKELF